MGGEGHVPSMLEPPAAWRSAHPGKEVPAGESGGIWGRESDTSPPPRKQPGGAGAACLPVGAGLVAVMKVRKRINAGLEGRGSEHITLGVLAVGFRLHAADLLVYMHSRRPCPT